MLSAAPPVRHAYTSGVDDPFAVEAAVILRVYVPADRQFLLHFGVNLT
jgi:hypothetical protein